MKIEIIVPALFGILYLVMFVNFIKHALKGPVGYEDKDGFHFGDSPGKPK